MIHVRALGDLGSHNSVPVYKARVCLHYSSLAQGQAVTSAAWRISVMALMLFELKVSGSYIAVCQKCLYVWSC